MTTPPFGTQTTIDPSEVAKFSALAGEWWDPKGKFGILHKFNPVRLDYIKEQTCKHFNRDPYGLRPFEGLRFLDIGCGGGLLTEPMCRLGATIVGVDPAEKNIKTASVHAQEQGLTIDYRATTAEALAEAGEQFDVILNMEVVEHVADPAHYIARCGDMVAPGGLMFLATINRTLRSFALAIVGAEYVLGWVPRGTHHWEKLITPDELATMTEKSGLSITEQKGVIYNPVTQSWRLSTDTSVNFMMLAERQPAPAL